LFFSGCGIIWCSQRKSQYQEKEKSKLNVKYYFGLEHESQGFGKKWWEVRIIGIICLCFLTFLTKDYEAF
jgi:hypothetical protein